MRVHNSTKLCPLSCVDLKYLNNLNICSSSHSFLNVLHLKPLLYKIMQNIKCVCHNFYSAELNLFMKVKFLPFINTIYYFILCILLLFYFSEPKCSFMFRKENEILTKLVLPVITDGFCLSVIPIITFSALVFHHSI